MNATHSDQGETITMLLRMPAMDATNPEYIRAVHAMAMNMLLDKDGKFNIRHYFGV